MPTTMRIKKGDLVQVLAGKDRGKQGRVLESRPRDRSVIVATVKAATPQGTVKKGEVVRPSSSGRRSPTAEVTAR